MRKKSCSNCHKLKSVTEFYRTGSDTWTAWCKFCHREHSHRQAKQGYFRARHDKRRGKPKRILLTPMEKFTYNLWSAAQKRARYRQLPFSLTLEWVRKEVANFCSTNYHDETGARNPFRPSIDREQPKLGYTVKNCRIVWLIENLARNTFTEEQLIEFCKRKLNIEV